MQASGELDYAVFLSPTFDSREYAQNLLNGGVSASSRSSSSTKQAGVGSGAAATQEPSGSADAAPPPSTFTLDKRSLEALQQLGLAHTSTTSLGSGNHATTTNPRDHAAPASTHAVGGRADKKTGNDVPSLHQTFSKAGSGDVSAALSKLSFAVEDLNRQLRAEINTHHSALLIQAGSVSSLEDNLRQIRGGLDEVEGSVDRLRKKIALPYTTLSSSLDKLGKLQRASDLARRASRFVTLARRLDVQMSELNAANSSAAAGANGRTTTQDAAGHHTNALKELNERHAGNDGGERALSEAALTLAELDVLMEEPPADDNEDDAAQARAPSIRAITAVEHHIPAVEANRARVLNEMEMMVRRGLQELNQGLLASSLQTAYNLSVLPSVVTSLVQDLIEAIESRIKSCFDVQALSRDALTRAGEPLTPTNATASVFYKSRARTEPTQSNLPHFQTALWARLDGLIEDMAGCCIKVHVLERVLKLKKDPSTQTTFLDDAMTILDNKPTFTFWTTLSQCFETQAREAARASPFIQQTLSTSYPRLLRLFHEFFSKIALQSDTVYAQNQQSPETVLILRSISSFESQYLNRCSNRMNESVAAAFSGGNRSPPNSQDGLTAARVLSNELDASRFDPLLVKNVAKNVGKAIDGFVDRAELIVATDYTATSMVGPQATASQQMNAEIATALYHFWSPLSRVLVTYPQNIQDQLRPNVGTIRQTLLNVVTPLTNSVKREFAAIIARIHRTGFNRPMDPTSVSVYMSDLNDKINFVRRHILGPLRVGDIMKERVTEISRFTLHRFVLHASIVQPLGEAGKLKLTTDLTTLEFAISQLLADYKLNLAVLGDDFRSLRAFRPLLFLETSALSDASKTKDVPLQVLLHHILVRSSGGLPLPHQMHGWQEPEYVKYVSEHTETENKRLVQAVIKDWEDKGRPDADGEVGECVKLAKEVLQRSP